MNIKRKIKGSVLLILLFLTVSVILLSRQPRNFTSREDIKWGITFSKYFCEKAGLDWRETYLAILDDLKPEIIRLPLYWPDIEPMPGKYVFSDYDWMVSEAGKRDVKLVLTVGRKTPRWPECHVPDWSRDHPEEAQQSKILEYMEAAVEHYKEEPNIHAWQIENEPFLPFGECPVLDVNFLDKEIRLARELDPKNKILVTDSGELSIWLRAAKRGDIFGTTMYRTIFSDYIGYFKYPLPPRFFWAKANLVHLFYPDKEIIVCELQAEPWGPKQPYETPLEDKNKSMSFEQFNENLEYAKQVGFGEVYLWGAEWWYLEKVRHGRPEFWEKIKETINNQQ